MIYTVSNGSGGSPNVQITTSPNATVTLSKGTTTLSTTADSDGVALFESVEYGSWTATATLGDKSNSIQVEVNETIEEKINIGLRLSSLPLKTTKLKIGGIKWILFTRDHEGYPSGAQTLVSEFILQNSKFGSTLNYIDSTVKSLCEQKYQAFSETEKQYVLETTRNIKNKSGEYPEFTEHMFILNSAEAGCKSDSQMGANLGFSNNADRICTIEKGAAQNWWLADASSSSFVCAINTGGGLIDSGPSGVYGVRPAMNLSSNTLLNEYPDEEGYYTIYREVNTASDLIVGDKVKIGGTKYVVKAKNHTGYPSNSVTLISEYLLQKTIFGSVVHYLSSTVKELCEEYYNQLSQAEQSAVALTTRKVKNGTGQYVEFSEHIFVLNSTEVGLTTVSQMGTNIGFADNADRIAKLENGGAIYWWCADAETREHVYCVSSSGTLDISNPSNDTVALRTALNLSPTAPIVSMDSDGYFSIVGADTISTLKDKSLNILGVKL